MAQDIPKDIPKFLMCKGKSVAVGWHYCAFPTHEMPTTNFEELINQTICVDCDCQTEWKKGVDDGMLMELFQAMEV